MIDERAIIIRGVIQKTKNVSMSKTDRKKEAKRLTVEKLNSDNENKQFDNSCNKNIL